MLEQVLGWGFLIALMSFGFVTVLYFMKREQREVTREESARAMNLINRKAHVIRDHNIGIDEKLSMLRNIEDEMLKLSDDYLSNRTGNRSTFTPLRVVEIATAATGTEKGA